MQFYVQFNQSFQQSKMSLKFVLLLAVSVIAQDIQPPDFSKLPSSRPSIIPPIVTCPDNYHLTPQGCVLNQAPCNLPTNCSPQAVRCFQSCLSSGSQTNCGINNNCNYQQTNLCSQQCQNQGFQTCNYPTNCQLPCNTPINCPLPPCLPSPPCVEHPTTQQPITTTNPYKPGTTMPENPNKPPTTTEYPRKPPTRSPTTRHDPTCRGKKCRRRKVFNYNIVFPAVNNTIVNINNITKPVYFNNHNQNNIYVYSSIECADGSIRTIIVNNNSTISECTDVTVPKTTPSTTTLPNDYPDNKPDCDDENCSVESSTTMKDNNQCCEIYTPRRCENKNGEWICGHRRYNYCLSFCGRRSKIYLQPRRPIYQGYILVVPALQTPNPNYCYGNHCNPPVGK
jgi:hypothetical protein